MVSLFALPFAQSTLFFAHLQDGEYNFQDNKMSLKVVIKNNNVEKFELNGVLIPQSEYAKYDDIINTLMNKLQKHRKAMDQNEKDRQALDKSGKKMGIKQVLNLE